MKNILSGIITLLLSGVLAGGVCACGYVSRDNNGKWFGNKDLSTWHWSDNTKDNTADKDNDNNTSEDFTGSVIGGVNGDGIKLLSARLPRSAYSANGVSETADSAYTLSAEVFPDYASDKSLDWAVAWQDSESEWASGKTVTDYVTITPTADGALTAVCACLQDFGEPVILTVSSRSVPEASVTVAVHYYQRVKSLNYVFNYDGESVEVAPDSNGVYKFDYTGVQKDYTVDLVPVYSNYTLIDEYATTVRGSLSSAFGYTAGENLSTAKITAGISGGEPKNSDVDSLRGNLSSFVRFFKSGDQQSESFSIGLGSYAFTIRQACNALSNSNHPFYLHVKNVAEKFNYKMTDYHGTQMPVYVSGASVAEIEAILNSYVAPSYNYYGASISTYTDFINAVKNCNSEGVGVIQYTVKIVGTYSTYETVLNLGYNDEFKVDVSNVNISDTIITF